MIKKGCIFTIALLLSMPGCKDRKKKAEKPKKMAKKIDLFSSVSIPLTNESTENDENRVLSFFDEDIEEFSTAYDDLNISVAVETGQSGDQDSTEELSWVEAVGQEDEFKVVYFNFDDEDVRSDQEGTVEYDIQQIKHLLAESEDTEAEATIVVEGHSCNSAGSPSYNLVLSERRAKKVADRLVATGISQSKIKVVGRGEEVPAVINNKTIRGSREDQWPNRRVEVRLIYT